MELLEPLIGSIREWAQSCADIVAVALIGSHARGAARAGSDVDLIVLTYDPDRYRRDASWVRAIRWPVGVTPSGAWRDEDYGRVWSRHVTLDGAPTIEFSFAAPAWAATEPIDAGTHAVVQNGCKVLWDPSGILARLGAAVSDEF